MAENETIENPVAQYIAGNKPGLTDEQVRTMGISAIDYEPHFDRLGTTRRVLGHITDDEHVGRGPRNTPERLEQELREDPYTAFQEGTIGEHLEKLVGAGLVEKREDGTYAVTEAGRKELVN